MNAYSVNVTIKSMSNDYIKDIHKKDKLLLHPYENLQNRGTYNRHLILNSEGIYLYDENGALVKLKITEGAS